MFGKTKTTKLVQSANVQLVLAMALFAVSVFLASDSKVGGWEKALFDFIHGWPASLEYVFLAITQLGNFYVLLVLALGYLFKKHYHVVLKLLMTGTLAYLLAGVGKDLVGRPRPLDLLLDATYRDYLVRGPGFPSGHVALATAMALSVGHYLPRRYKWLVALPIVGVALSRIYLGVHAPLDVIGGFAIGVAAYALFSTVRLTDLRRKSPQVSNKKRVAKSKN